MNKNKLMKVSNEKYNQELAVLGLINKHFWKSKIGPISALAIPLFLMIVYKVIGNENIRFFINGLPSYFSFSILPLCFISLPQMIVEFKTSIILRKISTSRIGSIKFSLIILSYHLFMIFCSTIIILIIYATFLNKDAPQAFESINWYQMIYVFLNIYLSCLTLGLLMGILINKINLVQISGFCIIIISVTFSGQFIPLVVVGSSDPIRYMSLFSPISYSLNQMNVVLSTDWSEIILQFIKNGAYSPEIDKDIINYVENYHFGGLFDISQSFDIFSFETNKNILIDLSINKIYLKWQNFLNLLMPYIFSSIFLGISIWKFKWTSR